MRHNGWAIVECDALIRQGTGCPDDTDDQLAASSSHTMSGWCECTVRHVGDVLVAGDSTHCGEATNDTVWLVTDWSV